MISATWFEPSAGLPRAIPVSLHRTSFQDKQGLCVRLACLYHFVAKVSPALG